MRSKMTYGAIGTVAAAALLLTGCAGGTDSADSGDPIDLRMTIWTSNEAHLALFNSIADAYIEENPEIGSISFDSLSAEDYTTTLTTQIAGGTPPDLAWMFEVSAPDFVESGALYPLDATLADDSSYELDDILEPATDLWRGEDGELLAYPFSNSPGVMFVNETLLAEAGAPSLADMQESGWTWDAVAEVGSQVNAATGAAGFVIRDFEYDKWDTLAAEWMGWGAAPWSADGATCTFNEPEMVDAFQFLHDAAFETNAMPGPGTSADFFAGESAFTATQISRAALLTGDFEWSVAMLPEGPIGNYSMIGQAGLGVLAASEHPEAAADFLRFFTNPENSLLLAEFFPPPRESLLDADILAEGSPALTQEQIEGVLIPAIELGITRSAHTNSAEISQEIRAVLDDLWVADAEVQPVLDDVCTTIQPILDR